MRFFPHQIPLTVVASATSASKGGTTNYLQNFSQLSIPPVSTASIALNFVGTNGSTGANYEQVGGAGPKGLAGLQGPRGKSVYLLSASWSSTTPEICYTINTLGVIADISTNTCAPKTFTYYSNKQLLTEASSKLYYDNQCITPRPITSNTIYYQRPTDNGYYDLAVDGSGNVTPTFSALLCTGIPSTTTTTTSTTTTTTAAPVCNQLGDIIHNFDYQLDSSGTKANDCGAYTDGTTKLYSNNCTEPGTDCILYTNAGCTAILSSACVNYNSYYCTDISGKVSGTGTCST
jgi:hypothetical protein